MKKTLIFLFMFMPLVAAAQSTLTPQQQLEQAQKQLEEAQKALDAAKEKAAKAEKKAKKRAEAEAKAKAKAEAEAKEKAAKMQKQAEELKRQAAELENKANRLEAAPETNSNSVSVPTSENVQSATDAATVGHKPMRTRLEKDKDDDEDEDKANKDAIYLEKGAVPVVNGKVTWTTTIKAPGKSADELYKIVEEYMTQLVSDKQQLLGSQVAVKKPAQHNVAATVHEWLTFRKSALVLDRTEIYYLLNAKCKDGQVKVTMSRIRYKYDVQGDESTYTAEEWITDKEAVNKKRTRLYPVSGKFRRKTIDRKNEIFQTLAEALQ